MDNDLMIVPDFRISPATDEAYSKLNINNRKRLIVHSTGDINKHGYQWTTGDRGYIRKRSTLTFHRSYYSTTQISSDGRTLKLEYKFQDKIHIEYYVFKGINLPIKWANDYLGLKVIAKDKIDYHIKYSDITCKNWIGNLKELLYQKRQLVKASKVNQTIEKNYLKLGKDIPVFLQDAISVGLCMMGINRFVKNNFDMDNESVTAKYSCILGKLLLRTNNEQAKKAVISAVQRQTLVCI